MVEAEQPADSPRRRRSTSVQRMLDLERKFKMDRLRSAPREAKPRPVLLTDPPPRKRKPVPTGVATTSAKTSRPDGDGADDANPKSTRSAVSVVAQVSYSARARESVGTTAASHQTAAVTKASRSSDETTSEAGSSICQSPSWDAYERRREEKKNRQPAEKPARGARLVKPPPSASRTPQLWVKSATNLLPRSTDHHNPTAFVTPDVPPPTPPKDGKFYTTRGRSGSHSSINSVASIASKIRSSFDHPRGRSASRESGSFLGGRKFWGKKTSDDEWQSHPLSEQNPTSYSLPARYMYRQPAGSGVVRQDSRSSSCSAVSSGSLAPHLMSNPPVLSFPLQQRHRGPPVSLRKPAPISRSRSSSRSGSSSPRVAHGSGLDDDRNEEGTEAHSEEARSSGRSPRSTSVPAVPSPSRVAFGEYPAAVSHPTSPGARGRKEYPPLSSVHAFASMAATESGEKPKPSRRRSLLGRVRGHRPADDENPYPSESPLQLSDDESRARGTTRNFRDAARAAFRRSTSRASNFRGRTPASEAPPSSLPTTTVVVDPFYLSSVNPKSSIGTPAASATGGPEPSPGSGPDTPSGSSLLHSAPEYFHRPRPIVDPHTVRPSDHSSVSSYGTAQSPHQSSTLTPNTSRPQSEKGVANNTGAADPQKVLPGGNEKPSPLPSGLPLRTVDAVPPVTQKSPRRALRNSIGAETDIPNPTEGVLPTAKTASAIPAPSATTRETRAKPEGSIRRKKVPSSLELAAVGMQAVPGAVDVSMFPKPLNLSPASEQSAKNPGQHKLRRQPKSRHFVSDKPRSPREIRTMPSPTAPAVGEDTALSVQSPNLIGSRAGERKKGPMEAERVEKVLVRCCGCAHLHDPPTRIFERIMSGPEGGEEGAEGKSPGDKRKSVRCPWCRHVMRARCCAGYVADVQLKGRLHYGAGVMDG